MKCRPWLESLATSFARCRKHTSTRFPFSCSSVDLHPRHAPYPYSLRNFNRFKLAYQYKRQLGLALTLFMLGILALDSYHALATNHFAFTANFLNRCPDLHDFSYDLTF